MSRAVFAAAALATAAGLASANTITGAYVGHTYTVGLSTTAGTFAVGALNHTWTNGIGDAARFNGTYGTFCIDNRLVTGNQTQFTLVGITSAPTSTAGNFGNPGFSYTAEQEKRLAAVVKAARAAGLMGNRGEFIAPSGNASHWAAALQLLIWESLWESTVGAGWDLNAGNFQLNSTNSTVTNRVNWLKNGGSANGVTITVANSATNLYNTGLGGIRALSGSTGSINERGQDQLVIIPLPPAAWAGISSLAGVIGFGYIRRRNLRA